MKTQVLMGASLGVGGQAGTGAGMAQSPCPSSLFKYSNCALAARSGGEGREVDLDQPDVVSKNNLELIPTDLIKKYLVLPLSKTGRLVANWLASAGGPGSAD